MKTLAFKVTMLVPDDLACEEARQYVNDAVLSWGGQFHPDEPLFGLEEKQVNVVRYRNPKR